MTTMTDETRGTLAADRANRRPDLLRAPEVCRALAMSRATLYRTPWLMQRAVRVGPGRRPRWEPATLELYKALNSGRAA